MESNKELGFDRVMASYGDYEVAEKGGKYRAYGYTWHYAQDAARESATHYACGRGDSPEAAVEAMVDMLRDVAPVREYADNVRSVKGPASEEIDAIEANLLAGLADLKETQK